MTKHLDSLKIENFRMLEDFEVAKLGQVNLIVGKNNSGKSTVLEALRIYASDADFKVLQYIAKERGEKFELSKEEYGDSQAEVPLKHLFTNSDIILRPPIKISDIYQEDKSIAIMYLSSEYLHEHSTIQSLSKLTKYTKERLDKIYLLEERLPHRIFICVGREGLSFNSIDHPDKRVLIENQLSPIANSFIPTQFLSINDIATKWDSIVFTDFEKLVTDALCIIEPAIQGLAFIQDKNKVNGERTAIVRLKDKSQPVPLKNLGDGMQRLLQIALSIYKAKDGFLLIDEFENGLHYSVQEKVWNLIFEMAKRLNIQVFATTHSWDCIEAFSKVAKEREDVEGLLFRMGRSAKTSDKGKVIATIFDEEKLQRFTQADMEVR